LPRQESAFGRWAWLVNGVAWLLFHLPFGPAILFTLGPTTLILPYVVQCGSIPGRVSSSMRG
jgi:hypothetical protein